jgi:flagellar motility protein MotE (MotC chaperone)
MSTGYDQFFKKIQKVKNAQASATPAASHVNKSQRFTVDPKNKNVAPQLKKVRTSPSAVVVRKKKAKFPIAFFVLIPFLVGVCFWSDFKWDRIENLLNRIEVRSMSIAGASEDEGSEKPKKESKSGEKASLDHKKDSAKNADLKKDEKTGAIKEKVAWTDEEIALFKNLDERKKTLDGKEAELAKLDEELQKQKKELDDRLKALDQMRQKIAAQLEERVQTDQDKVDKLVALYSNMKPQSAAKVLQDLNEELVVDILGKMKQKNAAEIMNLLAPEKAQRLSEKFAGYKRR